MGESSSGGGFAPVVERDRGERRVAARFGLAVGASLPAIGLGTLLIACITAFEPALISFLPALPSERGVVAFIQRAGTALGNAAMTYTALPVSVALVGVAVALHAGTTRWYGRVFAALVAAILAGGAILLGVSLGELRYELVSLWRVAVATAIGAGIAHRSSSFIEKLGYQTARILPLRLGIARVAVWLPFSVALYVGVIYALSIAVVVVLIVVALLLVLWLVFNILVHGGKEVRTQAVQQPHDDEPSEQPWLQPQPEPVKVTPGGERIAISITRRDEVGDALGPARPCNVRVYWLALGGNSYCSPAMTSDGKVTLEVLGGISGKTGGVEVKSGTHWHRLTREAALEGVYELSIPAELNR